MGIIRRYFLKDNFDSWGSSTLQQHCTIFVFELFSTTTNGTDSLETQLQPVTNLIKPFNKMEGSVRSLRSTRCSTWINPQSVVKLSCGLMSASSATIPVMVKEAVLSHLLAIIIVTYVVSMPVFMLYNEDLRVNMLIFTGMCVASAAYMLGFSMSTEHAALLPFLAALVLLIATYLAPVIQRRFQGSIRLPEGGVESQPLSRTTSVVWMGAEGVRSLQGPGSSQIGHPDDLTTARDYRGDHMDFAFVGSHFPSGPNRGALIDLEMGYSETLTVSSDGTVNTPRRMFF